MNRESSPMTAISANTLGRGKSGPRIVQNNSNIGGGDSAASLPGVSLSDSVVELIKENEQMLEVMQVMQRNEMALRGRVAELEAEYKESKTEVNELRNQLGDVNVSVSEKTGAVLNYKQECIRLQLLVDKLNEELDMSRQALKKATDETMPPPGRRGGADATKSSGEYQSLKREVEDSLWAADALVTKLKQLFAIASGTSGGEVSGRVADTADKAKRGVKALEKNVFNPWKSATQERISRLKSAKGTGSDPGAALSQEVLLKSICAMYEILNIYVGEMGLAKKK